MVRIFVLLAAAVLGGSPITKVINLLTALRDKVEADSHREMETYAQFQDWCALENQASSRTIADAKQAIEELEAEVKSLDTERLELKADVEKLVMQISEKERDIEREKKDRKEDHAEFDEADKSYGTSLDEIKRAIAIFKDPKRQQDLLQLRDDAEKVLDSVSSLAPQSSEQLRAFFEKTAGEGAGGPVSFLQVSAPSGAAYTTSQGTNTVVKLMEDIFGELKNSREAAQQEEVAAKHEYDMLKQSMEHELHSLEEAKADKSDEISENSNRVSQAKSQINDELKTLQQSETYLEDVREQCKTKAQEYKERQEVRGSEMKAIDGAVDALKSEKMKQAEQRKEASFAQQPGLPQGTGAEAGAMVASDDVVMSFVQVGDQPSGWSLEQIMTAAQQASHGGGTDKVKKMIEEMIAKLSGEAASEAQQSAWCNKEFSDTRQQKEEKEKMLEKTRSRLQNWISNQAQLKSEVKVAMSEASEIDKGVKEASKLRKDENAENVAAIKEYKNAQKLIATAVQFLTEFYEKQKREQQQASLLQQQQALENAGDDDGVVLQQAAQPEDASYNGQQDSAAGILALLEVAESDYKKLEQEVTTEEQVSASEYAQYMQEAKIRKAVLEAEVKGKQEEITRLNGSISGAETDIKEWTGELDKINNYLDQLNGACSFKAPTFEERAKRRKAQLESLQNALAILEGEGVPT